MPRSTWAPTTNRFAELTLATRARVQPFRRAQFRTLGHLAESHMEHEQIVVAILRGDRERAARAMNAHILTVREAYGVYAGGYVARNRGFIGDQSLRRILINWRCLLYA